MSIVKFTKYIAHSSPVSPPIFRRSFASHILSAIFQVCSSMLPRACLLASYAHTLKLRLGTSSILLYSKVLSAANPSSICSSSEKAPPSSTHFGSPSRRLSVATESVIGLLRNLFCFLRSSRSHRLLLFCIYEGTIGGLRSPPSRRVTDGPTQLRSRVVAALCSELLTSC
eukprot:2210-Heterococcus_DN1.PRE.2